MGCAACSFNRRDGCRLCWPEAIKVAQEEHAAVPPDKRVTAWPAQHAGSSPAVPSQLPKPEGKAGKKGSKAAAAAAAAAASAASPAEPPGDSMSPAPGAGAASAAGATSASTRRNKLLMAVNKEAVSEAHAAGKFALGCGRCRYSLTGALPGICCRWAAGDACVAGLAASV